MEILMQETYRMGVIKAKRSGMDPFALLKQCQAYSTKAKVRIDDPKTVTIDGTPALGNALKDFFETILSNKASSDPPEVNGQTDESDIFASLKVLASPLAVSLAVIVIYFAVYCTWATSHTSAKREQACKAYINSAFAHLMTVVFSVAVVDLIILCSVDSVKDAVQLVTEMANNNTCKVYQDRLASVLFMSSQEMTHVPLDTYNPLMSLVPTIFSLMQTSMLGEMDTQAMMLRWGAGLAVMTAVGSLGSGWIAQRIFTTTIVAQVTSWAKVFQTAASDTVKGAPFTFGSVVSEYGYSVAMAATMAAVSPLMKSLTMSTDLPSMCALPLRDVMTQLQVDTTSGLGLRWMECLNHVCMTDGGDDGSQCSPYFNLLQVESPIYTRCVKLICILATSILVNRVLRKRLPESTIQAEAEARMDLRRMGIAVASYYFVPDVIPAILEHGVYAPFHMGGYHMANITSYGMGMTLVVALMGSVETTLEASKSAQMSRWVLEKGLVVTGAFHGAVTFYLHTVISPHISLGGYVNSGMALALLTLVGREFDVFGVTDHLASASWEASLSVYNRCIKKLQDLKVLHPPRKHPLKQKVLVERHVKYRARRWITTWIEAVHGRSTATARLALRDLPVKNAKPLILRSMTQNDCCVSSPWIDTSAATDGTPDIWTPVALEKLWQLIDEYHRRRLPSSVPPFTHVHFKRGSTHDLGFGKTRPVAPSKSRKDANPNEETGLTLYALARDVNNEPYENQLVLYADPVKTSACESGSVDRTEMEAGVMREWLGALTKRPPEQFSDAVTTKCLMLCVGMARLHTTMHTNDATSLPLPRPGPGIAMTDDNTTSESDHILNLYYIRLV